jgi:hypothetical protein
MSPAPRCGSPVPWERLVDYWAGAAELSPEEVDAIDEHLFGCADCSDASASAARIAQAVRHTVPPVVSEAEVAALRARGLALEENRFTPGRRQEVSFPPGVDILIHRLGGLDLSRADRVDVTVRVESSGDVLFVSYDAPFNRDRGEVLMTCQRHLAFLPPDIAFDVRIREPGRSVEATFVIPHVAPAPETPPLGHR